MLKFAGRSDFKDFKVALYGETSRMGWARKTTSFSHFVFKPEFLPVAGPIIPYTSEEKFQIKSKKFLLYWPETPDFQASVLLQA